TPSLVGAAGVVRHSGARPAFARAGAPVRRLIVEFKPAAAGVSSSVVMGTALMSRAATSMRSALSAHVSRGLVTRLEASPAILTTRVTVPDSVRVEDAMAALEADASVASVTIDSLVP